jgi:hypothetical protein
LSSLALICRGWFGRRLVWLLYDYLDDLFKERGGQADITLAQVQDLICVLEQVNTKFLGQLWVEGLRNDDLPKNLS